jgi:molybdopterin-guanine dinucleotide biosynthesis protein A
MIGLEPLSAAILAGGKSRRMGRDKALLEIGGRPLLEIVADRLAPLVADLIVVASDRPDYDRFGLPVYPDRYSEAGSLGGIFTALDAARFEHCLVVACDMPLINPDLVAFMAAQPRDYDVLVPALPAERSDQGGDETLETLHAIYSKRCLPAIRSRLDAGRYKIVGFFDDVRVRRLDVATVRRFDPELHSFFNANTPEEFDWAAEQLQRYPDASPDEG